MTEPIYHLELVCEGDAICGVFYRDEIEICKLHDVQIRPEDDVVLGKEASKTLPLKSLCQSLLATDLEGLDSAFTTRRQLDLGHYLFAQTIDHCPELRNQEGMTLRILC
ncbi:MAG: hypothetical protein ACI957_004307 [Verrucomicrobiales bacterium]|jgi:hypothetical protein